MATKTSLQGKQDSTWGKTHASNTPPSVQSIDNILGTTACETRSDLSKGSKWGKKTTNGPYYNSAFIYLTIVFFLDYAFFMQVCVIFCFIKGADI